METPSPAASGQVRDRPIRVLAVVAVVAAVSLAGLGIFLATRPATISTVLSWSQWSPGTVQLEGIISKVTRVDSPSGPIVILGLVGDSVCSGYSVFGNPNGTYRVGDAYRTTLHFREFTYNGAAAVSAPELACPFPGLWIAFHTVMDAVSMVAGIGLVNQGTDAAGWTAYEFLTPNEDLYPLSLGPVVLRRSPISPPFPGLGSRIDSASRWRGIAEVEYVSITGNYGGGADVDSMANLSQGTSAGGLLRFVDSDGDGMAGDGDRIEARLGIPVEVAYQTYLLMAGASIGTSGIATGLKPILQAPGQPFEVPLLGQRAPFLQLVHISEVGGTSTIEIRRVEGTVRPYAEYDYSLFPRGGSSQSAALRPGIATLPLGGTITVTDGNGLLDVGDRISLSGFANQTELHFLVVHDEGTSGITWFTGYGHVSGRLPDVGWTVSGPSPYTFGPIVSFLHPEFGLGKTLAVSVFEDGSRVADHVGLAPGLVASWAGGNVSFLDVDGDGACSTGDEFRVQAGSPHRYRLELSALFDGRVYSMEWGP